MRRIKTLLVLVILALAVMSSAMSNRNQTLAADYRCTTPNNCPGQAQCSGDHFTQTGNCAISCYRDLGAPGQIVLNGSANCSPPPSGGGGGGGGGGKEFEGGYCYDNWFWDSNCEGDPYSLYEPWIN